MKEIGLLEQSPELRSTYPIPDIWALTLPVCQPSTNSNSIVRSLRSNLYHLFHILPKIKFQDPNHLMTNLFPFLIINLPISFYKAETLDTIYVTLSLSPPFPHHTY